MSILRIFFSKIKTQDRIYPEFYMIEYLTVISHSFILFQAHVLSQSLPNKTQLILELLSSDHLHTN